MKQWNRAYKLAAVKITHQNIPERREVCRFLKNCLRHNSRRRSNAEQLEAQFGTSLLDLEGEIESQSESDADCSDSVDISTLLQAWMDFRWPDMVSLKTVYKSKYFATFYKFYTSF